MRGKLPKVNTHSELIEVFKRLHKELVQLSKDPLERRFLDGFDFISWLEGKIENRPFGEIVREKAKNKTQDSRNPDSSTL